MLGMVAVEAGKDELALGALRKVTELAPKDVDGWATLGDVLFGKRLFGEAREVLESGLEACGDHPALLEKAIATAITTGTCRAPSPTCCGSWSWSPITSRAGSTWPSSTLLAQDFEKSEQTAHQLLKINPKSWEAWFHLGNLYEAMPLEKKAEEAYRKAIELGPDEWKPLANLGALLVEMKDRVKNAEAVPLLEQAQTVWRPRTSTWCRYNLALAHTRLGQEGPRARAHPEDPA